MCCIICATNLSLWLNGRRLAMSFAVPMVWREPSNHATACNFCMAPPISGGFTRKMKWTITYPNIPSAVRPVPHGEALPIHETPYEFTIDSDDEDEGQLTSSFPEPRACTDKPYVSHGESSAPHILTQDELNDLVSDLELSKSKTELLASKLQQWNLIEVNVRINSFRNRHQYLGPFFRKKDDLVF